MVRVQADPRRRAADHRGDVARRGASKLPGFFRKICGPEWAPKERVIPFSGPIWPFFGVRGPDNDVMLTLCDRDQAGSRARLSKLPDPWTQRARPPVLGKPAENAGFPQLQQDRH